MEKPRETHRIRKLFEFKDRDQTHTLKICILNHGTNFFETHDPPPILKLLDLKDLDPNHTLKILRPTTTIPP